MNAPSPECSVVIPVFNKWELTRNCLTSLCEHSREHDLEIIIVDNASSDATATELVPLGESLFGARFRVIRFEENKNFGPACNAGAAAATSSLLFFLNNDTILQPGWAPPLIQTMLGPNAPGAAGPLLLYENETIQHMGVAVGADGVLHLYQGFPATHPAVWRKRPLQFITGAAFMISASLFQKCGCFHKSYKNGLEDLELCVRVREQGKRLVCVPQSRIFHLESRTPGRKDPTNETANSKLFMERCGAALYIDLHRHALLDGFEAYVNDELALSLKLPETKSNALAREAEGKDAGEWLRLLNANPLWTHGWNVLLHALEQAGRIDETISIRIEVASLEPTIARYRELTRLAPLAEKNDPWPGKAMEVLERMLRYAKDGAAAQARFRQIRQRFQNGDDAILEKLYQKKLAAMNTARRNE